MGDFQKRVVASIDYQVNANNERINTIDMNLKNLEGTADSWDKITSTIKLTEEKSALQQQNTKLTAVKKDISE